MQQLTINYKVYSSYSNYIFKCAGIVNDQIKTGLLLSLPMKKF